jgi:plastocyanin
MIKKPLLWLCSLMILFTSYQQATAQCDSTIPAGVATALTFESGENIVVPLPTGTVDGANSTIDLFVVLGTNQGISSLSATGFSSLAPAWEAVALPYAVQLDAVLTGTTLTATGLTNNGTTPTTIEIYVGVYDDPVDNYTMDATCPYYTIAVTINPVPPGCDSEIPTGVPTALTVNSGEDIVIPLPLGTTQGNNSTIELFGIYDTDTLISDLATEGFTSLQAAWEATALPYADVFGATFNGTNLTLEGGFNNLGTSPITVTLYVGIYSDPLNSYSMNAECPYYPITITINPATCDSNIPAGVPTAITIESGDDIVVELPAGTTDGANSTIDLFLVLDANGFISDLATEGFNALQPAWEAAALPYAVQLDAVLTGTTLSATGFTNESGAPFTFTAYVGVYTDPDSSYTMDPICPYYPIAITVNPAPCDSNIPAGVPTAVTIESGDNIVIPMPAGTTQGNNSTIDMFLVLDENENFSDLTTEGFTSLQAAWEATALPYAANFGATLAGGNLSAAGFDNTSGFPFVFTVYVGAYSNPDTSYTMNPLCAYYPVEVTINSTCDSDIPAGVPTAITVESGDDIVIPMPAGTTQGTNTTIDMFVVLDENENFSDLTTEGFTSLQAAWEATSLPYAVNFGATLAGGNLSTAGFDNTSGFPFVFTVYVGAYSNPDSLYVMTPNCAYYPVEVTINSTCDSDIPAGLPTAITVESGDDIVIPMPAGTTQGTNTTIDMFVVLDENEDFSDLTTEGFTSLQAAWEATSLPYAINFGATLAGGNLSTAGFDNTSGAPITFTAYVGAYSNPDSLYVMSPNCAYYPIEITINPSVTDVCPTLSNFTQTASQVCSGGSVTLCAEIDFGTFPATGVVFSDGTTTIPATISGGATTHTIQVGAGGNNFAPSTVNAQVGDIIRWTWVAGFHTTTSGTIPAGATAWDQTLTGAGQQFEYTVTTPGTYNYFCIPHQAMGMTGTIIVSEAAPATACATISLDNTTCESIIKNYSASFDATTLAGTCTNTVLGPLGVTVYPNITATGVNGTCSASVTTNCPNFSVTYDSPAGSGSGNTLTLSPTTSEQSGTVTFTITQTGAPAGCNSTTATATYNCAATVCATLDDTQALTSPSICSGGVASLSNGGVNNGSFSGGSVAWSYSTTASFNPYSEGTAYNGQALSASGCNPSVYYFKARLVGVSACQDASEAFALTVYPVIVALPVNGTCSASVNVVGGCSNYTVSYTTSNGGSGSGNTFSVTPSTTAQSGTVTFTVANSNAPASCSSIDVTANYNCAALLCAELDGAQNVSSTAICSGQSISVTNGGVTANDFAGGSVGVKYSSNPDFDPYTDGTVFTGSLPDNTGCEAHVHYIKFYLNGVASCQDVSNAFMVSVYPSISGTVTNSNPDSCSEAMVNLLCDFSTTWVDAQGNSGNGTTYQPADGAVGTVTFTVTQTGASGSCGSRNFVASYNCSGLVCSMLDNEQGVVETAICSGQSLSITNGSVIDNDFSGGSVTWVYSTVSGFDAYSEGDILNGNLPANNTCNVITYFLRARLDGVVGCQDQSDEFAVRVYPNITATANNGTCSASVSVNCSNFGVTYSSSTGASGSGTSFTPANGESGTVTFTVTQTDAPNGCNTATVTANFNCPLLQCSELDGNQAISASSICSGQSLVLTNGAVIDNSYTGGSVTWVYGTTEGFDAYTEGMAFDGNLPANTDCNATTYYLKARLDGINDCQDQSNAFMVMVYPAIVAEVMTTTCDAMVMTNCDYEVSWQNLTNGMAGLGGTYNAAMGESAVVVFTINQSGAPTACGSLSLFADLNCPVVTCTPNEAGVCSLSLLSSMEGGRLDACSGDGFLATATGVQVNDASYAAGFILYSNPSDPTGSLIDSNADGVFPNDGSYPTGQVLYISSAVLAMPYATDFSASCNAISEPQEVMFLESISTTVLAHDCNFNTDTYTVTFEIAGGDGNYSIDGAAISGNVYTSMDIVSGEAYSFIVTDGAGCSAEVSGSFTCVQTPVPPVAENAAYTQLLSANATYYLPALTSDANGDLLTYDIIGYEPQTAGTLQFDAATGTIVFTPDFGAAGQTVVITYTVSDGIFDPVSGTITLTITDQLTCEQLAPINAEVSTADGSTSQQYNVYVTPTGGLPDADGSLYTVTLHDGFNTQTQQVGSGSVLSFENLTIPTTTFIAMVIVTDDLGCSTTIEVPVTISLAVELLSLRGEVLNNGNLLHWETASEINNAYFTVLRSTNGVNYEKVGDVAGAINSNTIRSYDLLDSAAPAGLSYYRLSQTDVDGTTKIVGNLTLTRDNAHLDINNLQPVPAIDQVMVSFSVPKAQVVTLQLFNAIGQLVYSAPFAATAGANQQSIDLSNMASGVYAITLSSQDARVVKTLVKQ